MRSIQGRGRRGLALAAFGFFAATAVVEGDEPVRPYGPIDSVTVADPKDKVDAPSVAPPAGATVLFDGEDLNAWERVGGATPAPAHWALVPIQAMQAAGGGSIRTKQAFDGRFRLHLEFRVPFLPDARGQARGNSGVYLQGRYEIQILDSYGLAPKDNECGAVYEVSAPSVNACKAPTVWQTYDIDFRAPEFRDGKKVAPARVTVALNGVTVQEDVAVPVDNTRSGLGGDPSRPGPVLLQDHGSPVQFRNVWLLKLQ